MAAPHPETFIAALHRLEEQNDTEGMVSLFADDAELSGPTDAEPHRGREGARRYWQAYRASFAEVHSEFRNVVADDGVAILEWTSRGRGAGGAPFEYDGVSVVEFEDGRIRRFRAYFDPSYLQAALSRWRA